LGYAIAFIEDEQRKARISRVSKRKPGGPRGTKWRNARAIAVVRQWGREGALKATQSMTQEQRSARASKAARTRWRTFRRAMREKDELNGQIELVCRKRKKRAKNCQAKSSRTKASHPLQQKRKSPPKRPSALSQSAPTRPNLIAQPRRSAPASTAQGAQA